MFTIKAKMKPIQFARHSGSRQGYKVLNHVLYTTTKTENMHSATTQ